MPEQQQGSDVRKRAVPVWFIVLVLLLLGFALFGDRGVLRVYKAYLQKTELEEKIVALEKTNAELRREIDALRNDLKAIEAIARRELGMVRPDEQVYQFHSDGRENLPEFPTEERAGEDVREPGDAPVDTRPGGG